MQNFVEGETLVIELLLVVTLVVGLPAGAAAHLGMRVRAHLGEPVISESTTFWKATYGKPTDFTLKKRYLIGALDEIDFVDTRDGQVLCRILPGQAHCADR